jgi:dephospho-CoA kinase
MITVGLTGSIGMGKSTVASLFAAEGAAVWSADEAVARLYAKGAPGTRAIGKAFPRAVRNGEVDREALAAIVLDDSAAFAELESLIHPLVAEDRARFLATAARDGVDVAVLDIPLLMEIGSENLFDCVIVVSAPADIQKRRVMARPGMTERKFHAILAKQTPDAEKRRRADFVIDTGAPLEQTRLQVREVMARLRTRRA